jgi:hypothetical protein
MLGHLGLASWLGCRRLAQNGPTALFRGKSELSDLHLIAFSKNFGALDPPEWRERLVVLVFHEATSEDTGVETLLPAQSFADHQSEVFGSHNGQIFIMNPDGSGKRMLTDSRWEDSMPLYIPAKFL